jgi:hypothetical protein
VIVLSSAKGIFLEPEILVEVLDQMSFNKVESCSLFSGEISSLKKVQPLL